MATLLPPPPVYGTKLTPHQFFSTPPTPSDGVTQNSWPHHAFICISHTLKSPPAAHTQMSKFLQDWMITNDFDFWSDFSRILQLVPPGTVSQRCKQTEAGDGGQGRPGECVQAVVLLVAGAELRGDVVAHQLPEVREVVAGPPRVGSGWVPGFRTEGWGEGGTGRGGNSRAGER